MIMNKIRVSSTVLFILGTLILSGCASLKKMKKDANKINYSVTPQVLETNAGNVNFAIQGNIPGKYLLKKAT